MSDVKNAQGGPGVEPVWDQKPPAWDEVRLRGTSGGLGGISGADWLLYGAVAAISLGIGVVNAFSAAQDAAWRGGVYDVRTPLFWEMSSIATIILVAPVLFVAVRRMRHVSGWPLRIALAVAAIIIFSGHKRSCNGSQSTTQTITDEVNFLFWNNCINSFKCIHNAKVEVIFHA